MDLNQKIENLRSSIKKKTLLLQKYEKKYQKQLSNKTDINKILKKNDPLYVKLSNLKLAVEPDVFSKIEKHYNEIFEQIEDYSTSLDNTRYEKPIDLRIKQEDKHHIKEIEKVVDTIFYFICKNDIDNYQEHFYNFKINDGSCVNELNTRENIYYFSKDKYIKIHTLPENYNVLNDYNHPLNFIFMRNLHSMDYYICKNLSSTESLKLNKVVYNKIIKEKTGHKQHNKLKVNYLTKLDRMLKKGYKNRYEDNIKLFRDIIGDFTIYSMYPKKEKVNMQTVKIDIPKQSILVR